MAWTDREGKIVLHSWGRFRTTMRVTVCDVGDLLSWRTTSLTEGVVVATDTTAAVAVALQNGAINEVIWCALAAELKAPPAVASTGGAVTRGYWDTDTATSDRLVGDPLYTTAAGKMTASASTTAQVVGHIIDSDRVLVVPANYLTATTLTLSGGLNVTGTCTFNGDITLGDGENLTLTKGNINVTEKTIELVKGNVNLTSGSVALTAGDVTLTLGNVNLTAGDVTITNGNLTVTAGTIKQVRVTAKTATATLTDAEQGIINVSPVAATVLTLPAAAAGKEFTFIHFKTAQYLNVKAGTGDKICDPADGGVHDYLHDDKGLDCLLTVHAINANNWYVTALQGDWTGA